MKQLTLDELEHRRRAAQRCLKIEQRLIDTAAALDMVRPADADGLERFCYRWEVWEEEPNAKRTAELFCLMDWLKYEYARYKAMAEGKRPQHRIAKPADYHHALSKSSRLERCEVIQLYSDETRIYYKPRKRCYW